jgi:hypothetical protein
VGPNEPAAKGVDDPRIVVGVDGSACATRAVRVRCQTGGPMGRTSPRRECVASDARGRGLRLRRSRVPHP